MLLEQLNPTINNKTDSPSSMFDMKILVSGLSSTDVKNPAEQVVKPIQIY